MYAVVGCGECRALWIVEGEPERSRCPRCGKTRAYKKRRQFVTTEDRDHARQVRSAMLANRGGHEDAFARLDTVGELDAAVEDAGIDDETYLEASGIDRDEVEAALDRFDSSHSTRSRQAVVREAIREESTPTRETIVRYAEERDVSAEKANSLLDKLVRAGEVSENRGTFRLL